MKMRKNDKNKNEIIINRWVYAFICLSSTLSMLPKIAGANSFKEWLIYAGACTAIALAEGALFIIIGAIDTAYTDKKTEVETQDNEKSMKIEPTDPADQKAWDGFYMPSKIYYGGNAVSRRKVHGYEKYARMQKEKNERRKNLEQKKAS